MKWSIELRQFGIRYQPRTAIKAQYVANFIAEFPTTTCKSRNDWTDEVNHSLPAWCLHVDGKANEQRCGVGLILTSPKPKHIIIEYAINLSFKVTNNKAEYEVLLVGLYLNKSLNVKMIHIYNDSQLIVKQVIEDYQARDTKMQAYLEKVKGLLIAMKEWTLSQILHLENEEADVLSKMTFASPMNITHCVLMEHLHKPSIEETEVLSITIPTKLTQKDNIIAYLLEEKLPEDKVEAHKLRCKVTAYIMIREQLYKREYSISYLRYLDKDKALYMLQEVHEGMCGNHTIRRSFVDKII